MKILLCFFSFFFATCVYAQNIGIGTSNPVTRLDVNGSFKVSANYISTTALPTAAQTFTMINATTQNMLLADSIARIFDPGGQNSNYIANLNSTFIVNGNGIPTSYLELLIESVDLGIGDSLIIYDGNYTGTPVIYRIGNGFTASNISVSFSVSTGMVVFKSNSDASTGQGFSLLFKRKFINNGIADPSIITGSSLVFYPGKAAFRAGTPSAGAIGNNSIALGYLNTASGANSSTLGYITKATGNSSIAMGSGATASGTNSTALGQSPTAAGQSSVAIGYSADALGFGSLAMGYSTIAFGSYSTSMGNGTHASGDYSTATGAYTNAKSYASFAIGRYNDTLVTESETIAWQSTDRAFVIGDGSSNTSRSNCFYVLKNGNGWMQGTLTQASDIRLKKDIIPLRNVLSRLLCLSGYNYYWKNTAQMPDLQSGLIAQEVQKQMPELVTTSNADGELAVNYSGMIPYLLEGIKEQQEELNRQKEKIKILEDEIKAIKKILLSGDKK